MAKIIEEYNPQKIEIVKRMLDKQSEKGTPMAYEISVDNFKVVMKTTDLSDFDGYEDLITNQTKYIRINVYSSMIETGVHTKYVFELKGEKSEEQTSSKGLGEVEVNTRIKESLAIERDRWDKEQICKELESTKHSLKEAEEYIEKMQAELEKVKLKPNHLGKLDLGLLAGSALEGMVRKNPQWLTKVPGFEGLAGVIEKENKEGIKQTPVEETEVSFKKKEGVSDPLSKEDQSYLSFGKSIAEEFDDDEMEILVLITTALGKDTSKLKTVAELLDIKVPAK